MKRLSDEIRGKNEQIALLEKQIANSIMVSHNKMDKSEISQVSSACIIGSIGYLPLPATPSLCSFIWMLQYIAELVAQLNEKSFELEVINFLYMFNQECISCVFAIYTKDSLGTKLNQVIWCCSSNPTFGFGPLLWVPM